MVARPAIKQMVIGVAASGKTRYLCRYLAHHSAEYSHIHAVIKVDEATRYDTLRQAYRHITLHVSAVTVPVNLDRTVLVLIDNECTDDLDRLIEAPCSTIFTAHSYLCIPRCVQTRISSFVVCGRMGSDTRRSITRDNPSAFFITP